MGKRELIALLGLSSWCLEIVVWLFLAMQQVSLQFVIAVFPDLGHLLFLPRVWGKLILNTFSTYSGKHVFFNRVFHCTNV